MTKYYNRSSTPLSFHSFLRFVSLPIGALTALSRLIVTIGQMEVFHWLYVIDIVFYALSFALMLICFRGFFKWSSYAWNCLMIYLCTLSVYTLCILIIYAVTLPSQTATALGQFLGSLLYSVLVGIYYLKRKPLFFTTMAKRLEAMSQHESAIPEELSKVSTSAVGEAVINETDVRNLYREQEAELQARKMEALAQVRAQKKAARSSSRGSTPRWSIITIVTLAALLVVAIILSFYFVDRANKDGYNLGHLAGVDAGYDYGFDAGYTSGSNVGTDAAYVDGYDEGYDDGYDDGYVDSLIEYSDEYSEYDFYHRHAVIVTTTGGSYHTYGCPHIEGRDFYIFNIESAKAKGYEPCLDCMK